jgi:hypothetical protein
MGRKRDFVQKSVKNIVHISKETKLSKQETAPFANLRPSSSSFTRALKVPEWVCRAVRAAAIRSARGGPAIIRVFFGVFWS